MIPGIIAGGGAIAAPYVPPDFPVISGLFIHLDASNLPGAVDGVAVTTWTDIGPNNYSPTQATSGNRPIYRATGLNGKPALEFDGSNDNLAKTFGTTYAQPNTLFVVMKVPSGGIPASGQFPWVDGSLSTNRHWLGSTSLSAPKTLGIWAGDPFLKGTETAEGTYIFRSVYNGASSSLHDSGGLRASGTTSTGGLSGITLGSRYDNAQYTKSLIAEVIGYNRVLTSGEIADVEGYLLAKYGQLPGIGLFGSYVGAEKWAYGVLADNGKIYCAPFDENRILKIDPSVPSASTIGTSLGSANNSWIGFIKAASGNLYAVPGRQNLILKVDPTTDTITSFTPADYNEYYGGALADNGKIYCCPFTKDNVLVIDPATDTSALITGVTRTNTTNQWGWFIKGNNGKLYAAPRSEGSVLVVDPSADTLSYIATGMGTSTLVTKYAGGVRAQSGEIYFTPRDAETLLIVDPATDTVRTAGTLPAGHYKWTGGIAVGKYVFFFPRDSNTILRVDCTNDNIEYFDTRLITVDKWVGAVSDGTTVFMVPFALPNVGFLSVEALTAPWL